MASAPSTTTPAAGPSGSAPAATGSTTSAPTISAGGTSSGMRITNSVNSTFGMPSGISLPVFDGSDYNQWAGTLEAILALHEADDVIFNDTAPAGANPGEFATISRRAKVYLRLLIKPDVYSLIASDTDYPTFKNKWDQLRNTYGGASGSVTIQRIVA